MKVMMQLHDQMMAGKNIIVVAIGLGRGRLAMSRRLEAQPPGPVAFPN